jgi:hypothetical protein
MPVTAMLVAEVVPATTADFRTVEPAVTRLRGRMYFTGLS